MTSSLARLVKNPLIFASAAVLLQVGMVSAGEAADLQQQMRDLLTGSAVTAAAAQRPAHAEEQPIPTLDSQEYMKRVLLGATRAGGPVAAPAAATVVAHTAGTSRTLPRQTGPRDIQLAVRQVLLGVHPSSDAS